MTFILLGLEAHLTCIYTWPLASPNHMINYRLLCYSTFVLSTEASMNAATNYAKASRHLFQIVIVIVGIFFITRTIGNGFMMLCLWQTNLQADESVLRIFFLRASGGEKLALVAPWMACSLCLTCW